MKKLMLAALLLPGCLIAQALRSTNNLNLVWDFYPNPEGDTGLVFHIYRTTNIVTPNWQHYTNVDWLAASNHAGVRSVTNSFYVNRMAWPIPNEDGVMFHVITVSNITGESLFSDPASTRRPERGVLRQIGKD